jgi:excisionase family DNA binding protein
MTDKPVLLTVQEFSETLNITVACTRRWLLERRVSCIKLGRAIRIPHTELERLLTAGLRPARPIRSIR